jgi:hypothetical protein
MSARRTAARAVGASAPSDRCLGVTACTYINEVGCGWVVRVIAGPTGHNRKVGFGVGVLAED